MVFDRVSNRESAEFERFLDQLRADGRCHPETPAMTVTEQTQAVSGTVAEICSSSAAAVGDCVKEQPGQRAGKSAYEIAQFPDATQFGR